jgi:hypothetical protein
MPLVQFIQSSSPSFPFPISIVVASSIGHAQTDTTAPPRPPPIIQISRRLDERCQRRSCRLHLAREKSSLRRDRARRIRPCRSRSCRQGEHAVESRRLSWCTFLSCTRTADADQLVYHRQLDTQPSHTKRSPQHAKTASIRHGLFGSPETAVHN